MSKFDDRLDTILDAATELMAKYGFYGTSLDRISDMTGMSKQNLLYYVKNKKNLLTLIITERYDETPEFVSFTNRHTRGNPEYEGPTPLPAYYRLLARVNEQRPVFVQLFSMLNVETLEPSHPAHDYFVKRENKILTRGGNTDWQLPPGVDLHTTMRVCDATMDGIQVQWLHDTSTPLTELWAACEERLFPSPTWDGYR
ncbi:TetR/AcrR family transcriptional regulator [Bifidobacterium tissieri]|uniref:TetR/AcrR family transcriptional regulator n=1 Tax=Bifidobacterium tissieri TaxID=1630162 RepID=A0A5M9ZNR8_9BIFI|nr:TetR/AcrR family transcriptional regulator [Bifidobacterium tissieri]KAA8829281.1 TetR/AcrR family transcriptional regulator [Bifidobacterium tissieri]KAA8831885.1 TetR/AcrR family transcriptional regulator [Bifidobacterium tissieri]